MKTAVPARPHAALLFVSIAPLVASCGFEPSAAPRSYELDASTIEALDGYPDVQGQIRGALAMLYGTPQEPRYMVTGRWLDDGYDPNYPRYAAADGGSGAFDDAQLDALQADNERRFSKQLALLEAKRFEEVRVRRMPELDAYWRDVLGRSEELGDGFADQARRTFVEYYPTLSESAELYRRQCLHCHGNSGGGDGPTAASLSPRPRDYRRGIFKFTAVKDKARPRREDLLRILTEGVNGTAMPSFRRFSDAQLHGLIDYVMLLSKRGESERLLVAGFEADEVLTAEMVVETYMEVEDKWRAAEDYFVAFDGVIPEPTPAMIARGRALFEDDARGGCAKCHGVSGRGDGDSAYKDPEHTISAYDDDWGHPIFPRNLVGGIFRGGKRPIDIYRRIYSGINGTPMPAVGESTGADGERLLDDDAMWALVHYVRSLSERPDGFGLVPIAHVARSERGDTDASAKHEGPDPVGQGGAGR